jgi:hypothetical protein
MAWGRLRKRHKQWAGWDSQQSTATYMHAASHPNMHEAAQTRGQGEGILLAAPLVAAD